MQKMQNAYQVTLNYWVTVEVTAGSREEAIDKAHNIDCSGSLEGGEETVVLLEGKEPLFKGKVDRLADSDEEAAYVIARKLELSAKDYFMLRDDIANLRAGEWLGAVTGICDPYFQKQFKQYFGLGFEDEDEEGICPYCGNVLTEHPALSRRGEYYVCPDCGTREAVEDYAASIRKGA